LSILRQSSGARRREAGCKLFANAKVLHIWGTAVNTLLQGGSDFIFSGGTASGTCAYRLCHPNVVPMETAGPSD